VCVCVCVCVMRILLQAVQQLHQTGVSLQLNCKHTKYLYCTYANNLHNLNVFTDILQFCKKTEIRYAEIVFLITKKSTETLTSHAETERADWRSGLYRGAHRSKLGRHTAYPDVFVVLLSSSRHILEEHVD